MPSLSRFLSPVRLRQYARRYLELWRRNRGDDAVDRELRRLQPLKLGTGSATIIADGMWRNPNHFFRLRLFLEALSGCGDYRLLGILRRRASWRERRALERLGFKEFVYLDEDEICTAQFMSEAERLLANVTSHKDLLALRLPDGLPAYVYCDTVMKLASDPQPALTSPLWIKTLAELLRDLAIYRRELASHQVAEVVVSHPWKNEWAALTWLALGHGVRTYHLTGFCEGIRIRRFRNQRDYATPVEHLPRAAFDRLPPDVRDDIARIGFADLARRASGRSSDLNARYAFNPARRIAGRNEARFALSGQTEKPIVVVYGHVWYDFPHTFAMSNFSDFRDWITATLAQIEKIDDVIWLLKPHPTEAWYGGFSLADAVAGLPPHIRMLPLDTDSQTVINAADAIVTVHGTIGLEAAAQGVPVIVADRSYYSDWDVAHAATSRNSYFALLGEAGCLPRPDHAAQERARACFALALGEPPDEVGALRISCDSTGSKLYDEISGRYRSGQASLVSETARVAAFLAQDHIDSFAAFHLVETVKRGLIRQAC
jgi:hypothetical protein